VVIGMQAAPRKGATAWAGRGRLRWRSGPAPGGGLVMAGGEGDLRRRSRGSPALSTGESIGAYSHGRRTANAENKATAPACFRGEKPVGSPSGETLCAGGEAARSARGSESVSKGHRFGAANDGRGSRERGQERAVAAPGFVTGFVRCAGEGVAGCRGAYSRVPVFRWRELQPRLNEESPCASARGNPVKEAQGGWKP